MPRYVILAILRQWLVTPGQISTLVPKVLDAILVKSSCGFIYFDTHYPKSQRTWKKNQSPDRTKSLSSRTGCKALFFGPPFSFSSVIFILLFPSYTPVNAELSGHRLPQDHTAK